MGLFSKFGSKMSLLKSITQIPVSWWISWMFSFFSGLQSFICCNGWWVGPFHICITTVSFQIPEAKRTDQWQCNDGAGAASVSSGDPEVSLPPAGRMKWLQLLPYDQIPASILTASDELVPCGGCTRLLSFLPVFLLHENPHMRSSHLFNWIWTQKYTCVSNCTVSDLYFQQAACFSVHAGGSVCLSPTSRTCQVSSFCWKLVCLREWKKRKTLKWLHDWIKNFIYLGNKYEKKTNALLFKTQPAARTNLPVSYIQTT